MSSEGTSPRDAADRSASGDGSHDRKLLDLLHESLGDEYEIRRELGEGSMARVFLARNRMLGRLVAIKVLLPGRGDDETARKRFEREAKASASLSHPHVVDVYRFGRLEDGTPYLVMRFVKGRTMEERMRVEGRLDPDTVRTVLREVASGLAAAHDRGMVHRDVRPGNILWDEERGQALLSDFGIVGILDPPADVGPRLTQEGQLLGDVRYQSPEQLLDEPVTELADIYAFGVTGYELLTGEGPYGSRRGQELVAAHLTEEPRDLRALRAEVDPGLADLLRRCLAREPKHRPSARDVVRTLERSEGEAGIAAASPRTAEYGGTTDLQQLIRRRVPQIVLIAAGVGWGLMTLVDQLVDRGVLPDVAYRLTLPFVACGLVASTVVAWFHGERGKQSASLTEWVLLAAVALLWIGLSIAVLVLS